MSIVLLNRELPRQLADSYCQTASEENAQPHGAGLQVLTRYVGCAHVERLGTG
jgi:hypothetical protein